MVSSNSGNFMNDVINDITRWVNNGEPVVMATVVNTWGSSPRGVGAKMAFTPDGKITGSVSGGCVESQVFESGIDTLHSGKPQLLRFGVADETAFEVGLACGGNIEIFVAPLDQNLFRSLEQEISAGQALAMSVVVEGPDHLLGQYSLRSDSGLHIGNLDGEIGRLADQKATNALGEEIGSKSVVQTSEHQAVTFFTDVIAPPPTLVMIGGVHIAIALARIAKALDYRTCLIDPRRAFGNLERFPHVDQLIQAWPQEALGQIKLGRSTCVALLTHDPKIDDPAIKYVLDTPVFYIGALGSKKTHASRRQRLLADGISEEKIARIHAPIGINLGAVTPEEIALSVMAQIVAVRRGQSL
jgi:xanthine dehydrogenase accessory factor